MAIETSRTMKSKGWQFWIDRGGTFTDIVAYSPEGELIIHKLLSENLEQYQDAAVEGIRHLLGVERDISIPRGMIDAVKMGTTIATNALLERKGERVLLLITQGFGDLLRIGYQNRPNIFDLHIVLPEQLYEDVSEIEERISATGEVIIRLDEETAHQALTNAYQKGIRALAIAFMHGYAYPAHEKCVAEIAREIGFTQISMSHDVSPLIKLVARGDTTVVDAYLTPILRQYMYQVQNALNTSESDAGKGNIGKSDNHSLQFMQSNGGLTDATFFRGKDSILSGPAGGVVGMVKTASAAGFDKLIGFDMGGTSTDVCHFAGEYERSFETEIAGVRIRAPMMGIHTVAAGGGSILTYKDQRFQVGPESAGANPGPACYRRGGSLTVTDCNVLLGKLQPEYFPHVFGPNANQPLDVDSVQEKFLALAEKIALETGTKTLPVEEIAEGFLRVAVQNMANAIKKISVQRGYDVTSYVLNCFGGAGGQHACLVADALGIKTVFIHPFAGVLSAFGMGLADIRAMREHHFEKPLNAIYEAISILQQIEEKALIEVLDQDIVETAITIKKRAHLRYKDSHQSIAVPFGKANDMQYAFEAAHKRQYGFIPNHNDLIIDMLVVEVIGTVPPKITRPKTKTLHNWMDKPTQSSSNSSRTIRMYSGGLWGNIPLYNRQQMALGTSITGPAMIIEPTGTNIIEAGWQAEIDEEANLILRRKIERQIDNPIATDIDPIMLEVFSNLFMSVAEQMGITLANTAYSVNIKERLDFSCAIFDAAGRLVANAPHVPVHLGSMGESVRTILRMNAQNMKLGDVFMMNNPFNGGTHLPDVTIITPVFDDNGKDIIFFVASRGHHADIGGITPGSAPPDSKHIEEEGIVIDNFKLVDGGELCEEATRTLLSSPPYPCRNIDQNMADLTAQIAANATGARELHTMIDNFSLPVVQAYMEHVQNNAEESVRRVIDVLKDSAFCYKLDSGTQIQVKITINQKERSATLDFTGTSAQDTGNYNAPLSICRAAVLYVFRTLVGDNIPMNEGCMKPIHLIIPEGTMINPTYPAAVIAGNTEVSQAITETLYGALGILAGSQGTMNNFIYGNEDHQNYETICGGAGAGPTFNGASAVHTHMTNTRMTDPEVLEKRFPVLVKEFSIRQNSGGEGSYYGGDGVVRCIEFLEPMTATVLSSHRITQPFGAAGGMPGKTGENYVIRADGRKEILHGNDSRIMQVNDIFCIKTPGGGGFGSNSNKR